MKSAPVKVCCKLTMNSIKYIKTNFKSLVTNIKFNNNCWEITINNKEIINFKNLILTCPYPQLVSLGSKYLPKQIIKSKIQMVPNIIIKFNTTYVYI